MLYFTVGVVVGCIAGVMMFALCIAAGKGES